MFWRLIKYIINVSIIFLIYIRYLFSSWVIHLWHLNSAKISWLWLMYQKRTFSQFNSTKERIYWPTWTMECKYDLYENLFINLLSSAWFSMIVMKKSSLAIAKYFQSWLFVNYFSISIFINGDFTYTCIVAICMYFSYSL